MLVTADGDAATVRPTAAGVGRAEASTRRRRVQVIRRLLDQGMPPRVLEALLPGWEEPIAAALEGDLL